MTSSIYANYCRKESAFKVVVRAEILPRDFLQTLGNFHLWLTIAKIQRLKNFTVKKFGQLFKGFDREIISFQEWKDFPPRDFDKSLQTCAAAERHQMKKLKFHRLYLEK